MCLPRLPGPDNKFAEKAMTLLPDDISDRGYDAVLGYLWMMGKRTGQDGKPGFSMTSCVASMSMANILRLSFVSVTTSCKGWPKAGFLRQRRRGAFRQAHVAACDACAYGQRWWS